MVTGGGAGGNSGLGLGLGVVSAVGVGTGTGVGSGLGGGLLHPASATSKTKAVMVMNISHDLMGLIIAGRVCRVNRGGR